MISTDPESDAISRMYKIAKENGIENPRVVGFSSHRNILEKDMGFL